MGCMIGMDHGWHLLSAAEHIMIFLYKTHITMAQRKIVLGASMHSCKARQMLWVCL